MREESSSWKTAARAAQKWYSTCWAPLRPWIFFSRFDIRPQDPITMVNRAKKLRRWKWPRKIYKCAEETSKELVLWDMKEGPRPVRGNRLFLFRDVYCVDVAWKSVATAFCFESRSCCWLAYSHDIRFGRKCGERGIAQMACSDSVFGRVLYIDGSSGPDRGVNNGIRYDAVNWGLLSSFLGLFRIVFLTKLGSPRMELRSDSPLILLLPAKKA